jgi:acyl-CoA reductase-like NAD-dependent aldehyde dehydrogenase
MSTERIVVQRSIADDFRKALVEATEKAFGKDVPAPVLVSAAPVDKNRKLIADAISKGAKVLYGDLHAREASAASMRPLIVENVTKEMDLHYIESFGPTVSLVVVDTEEEAIAWANDTDYGLTSAVFTEDLRRGLRVAKQIEAGYATFKIFIKDFSC